MNTKQLLEKEIQDELEEIGGMETMVRDLECWEAPSLWRI